MACIMYAMMWVLVYIHQKLQSRVKELELQHRSNSQQSFEVSDLECSNSSVSVGNLDTSLSTAGDDGDMEQGWVKYREMKVKDSCTFTHCPPVSISYVSYWSTDNYVSLRSLMLLQSMYILYPCTIVGSESLYNHRSINWVTTLSYTERVCHYERTLQEVEEQLWKGVHSYIVHVCIYKLSLLIGTLLKKDTNHE